MNIDRISKILDKYHKETDDNVIGVSYGYKEVSGKITNKESIVFTVKEKLPVSKLPRDKVIPKSIKADDRDLPTDVVQGKFKLMGISDCDSSFYTWRTTPPGNRNETRPLQGGLSCGNYDNQGLNYVYVEGTGWVGFPMEYFVGTLGLLAVDNETNSLVALTNNHVIIYDAFICSERTPYPGGDETEVNNVKGDNVCQPQESSTKGLAYSIGKVKRYYPIRSGSGVYNQIDAALTTIDSSGDISDTTSWQQFGLTPPTNYPWATTSEINNLPLGTILYSTGRTTGAKGEGTTKLRLSGYGDLTIDYTKQGSDVTVNFNTCFFFIATLTESGEWTDTCYDPISGGDSGSALIADIGGVKKIIGLVFAGGSDETGKTTVGIACRIDTISTLLDVSAWNGEPVNYSDTSNIMEVTAVGLDDREYIDSGGIRYWQVGLRNKV